MIYLLLALGGVMLARQIYKFISVVTIPTAGNYIHLVKNLTQSSAKMQDSNVKTQFMQFVVDLGIRSLNNQTGVGYFRLPQLGQVYVLSNPSVIKQFYEKKNESNFSQLRFFNRLALILGPDNLMSSPLNSPIHARVRKSIFNRNEKFIPNLAALVNSFFLEYSEQKKTIPLAEVMNALSRRVLLTTYFDKCVVEPFEKIYDPQLTKALLSSIFELETITEGQHHKLIGLRNKLFKFGSNLLLLPEVKKQLFGKNNWLNYLLHVRIEENSRLLKELGLLGIHNSPAELDGSDWEILLYYAAENLDKRPLSSVIRDVINESLFIPLLGFDATATMLITSLKIAIQDPRIGALVKEEIQQLKVTNRSLELHGISGSNLSYTEAVILEALRLSPPAPVIPEIVTNTFCLNINGRELELPQGALVFMPMEGLHTHRVNHPDILLSKKGQSIFNQTAIDSKTIFPERWNPVNPHGKKYNSDFFKTPYAARDSFFPFKKGARECPGQRIALGEALGIFELFNTYDFHLTNEEPLNFPYSYDSPFQRNGGQGTLQITPKDVISKNDKGQGQIQASSLPFFSKEFALNEIKDGFTYGDSVAKKQRFG